MRIVQHTFDFGLGGIQKAPCVFAAEMAAQGHECYVLAERTGPRYSASPGKNQTHIILGSDDPAVAARVIDEIAPDIVHLHRGAYVPALVRLLAAQSRPERVIISSPVFGRPPDDPSLLDLTRTCLVGCYTFYRFCRWTSHDAARAIGRGIGYVPITPYHPPVTPISTLDAPADIASRRADLGLPADAFVVGRIGRDDPGKWSDLNESLVNALLEQSQRVHWLSIGFPDEMGRARLTERWGQRFINLPPTSDYQALARVLSSLDLHAFFSRGECFASSIAEGAGLGVPTVALVTPLRDNGQVEQVIDGVTGRLVRDVAGAVKYVSELMNDPAALASIKASSRQHAINRWHVERATRDLLALYEHWRSPAAPPPPYVQTMLDESRQFAADYRPRMVQLMSRGPLERARWRAALALVESWTTFRGARFARRLRNWKAYRALQT